MKNKKILFTLPLVTLLTLFSSCGASETGKFEEYYDSNWKPGSNSLKVDQPTLKNPVGKFNTLNEIKRTQDKVGLPSQGEANILVVPVNFKNDDELQKEYGEDIDITFSEEDLKEINDMYFNTKNTYAYPSVCNFYKQSSFNKLNLSGVVSPVVTLPNTYIEYIETIYAHSYEDVYKSIIDYVYNYLFVETQTYYIGDFDSDNDKRVDAISIVCNYSYDLNFGNDTFTSLHQGFVGPNNVLFSDSIDDLEKTPVNSYSFISSSFRKLYYLNHDSRQYINLVGQMIGLNNYEDMTVNPTTSLSRAPLGYYDMMSGAIGDHNSFSKYQLGWIEPKFIKAEDISNDGLEVTIESSVKSGDAIVLYTGEKSLYGEYLVIDLYSPSDDFNKFDVDNASQYTNKKLFNQEAIRVYQVDSRLVRGYGSSYIEYEGEPNFDETKTLENGDKVSYVYDYAYTNDSVNNYEDYGFKNYPLVSLLSKSGTNRHLTYSGTDLTIDDMFLQGDSFGSDDQLSGFYKDFSFHGNGLNDDLLNITFEVKSISNGKAELVFRRAK